MATAGPDARNGNGCVSLHRRSCFARGAGLPKELLSRRFCRPSREPIVTTFVPGFVNFLVVIQSLQLRQNFSPSLLEGLPGRSSEAHTNWKSADCRLDTATFFSVMVLSASAVMIVSLPDRVDTASSDAQSAKIV
jgi:hypothetical protein